MGKIKQKIREIRRSDQKTKRKWLIGMTAATMIVIIFLWVGYLNLTVPQVPKAQEEEDVPVKTEQVPREDSIFSVFSRGFKETTQSISGTFGKIKKKVSEMVSGTKKRLENVKEYTPPSN